MDNKHITSIILLSSALLLGSCEDFGASQWPGPPTILSESELARNGFQFSHDSNSGDTADFGQLPLDGFEESPNWVGDGMQVRLIYGGLVGTESSALKIGPAYKDDAEAVLCMDFPVPNSYNSIILDARSRLSGLKISIAVGDFDGSTVYQSAPVDLTNDWQRGIRFDLRQQDGWKLQGEDVYSRSFPELPISSLRIILSGETRKNAAVIDNIVFK